MKTFNNITLLLTLILMSSCRSNHTVGAFTANMDQFPKELVEFIPYEHNPIFSGTDGDTWDQHIRERGFILFEDNIYKMWYTGYVGGENDPKSLGYATSPDGIKWTRYPKNPVFSEKWTEDMFVIKDNGTYYMYAEGKNDIAHLLTSGDGIHWQEQGNLVILNAKGDTISGPYGTPSILIENGQWYLFYERNDDAIWLAVSNDHITWKNVQDEPVLHKGPGSYDSGAVAANQVILFNGKYYMYYHGSSNAGWDIPGTTSLWTSNVAMSTDLIHWIKYPKNPIVEGDHSSPVMVYHDGKYRLYTMHDKIWIYFAR
jgi:beta-1,2-mannobiose phosphorylase / 1,2-beta-oligomannan phosphorylase